MVKTSVLRLRVQLYYSDVNKISQVNYHASSNLGCLQKQSQEKNLMKLKSKLHVWKLVTKTANCNWVELKASKSQRAYIAHRAKSANQITSDHKISQLEFEFHILRLGSMILTFAESRKISASSAEDLQIKISPICRLVTTALRYGIIKDN